MTGGEIMAVVGFFLTLAGAASAVWWRIEGKVKEAKTDTQTAAGLAQATASLALERLAEHKLHVAETYVTKAGMQEQTAQIMKAIDAVGDKIDRTNERLDRVFETPKPRRSAS